ncbi:unnamed protein product [Sphagnum tenellum]
MLGRFYQQDRKRKSRVSSTFSLPEDISKLCDVIKMSIIVPHPKKKGGLGSCIRCGRILVQHSGDGVRLHPGQQELRVETTGRPVSRHRCWRAARSVHGKTRPRRGVRRVVEIRHEQEETFRSELPVEFVLVSHLRSKLLAANH